MTKSNNIRTNVLLINCNSHQLMLILYKTLSITFYLIRVKVSDIFSLNCLPSGWDINDSIDALENTSWQNLSRVLVLILLKLFRALLNSIAKGANFQIITLH